MGNAERPPVPKATQLVFVAPPDPTVVPPAFLAEAEG
jgi:hypothetical protein